MLDGLYNTKLGIEMWLIDVLPKFRISYVT